MILLKIALGLVGLGVVVFVHELGHFIVAKLSGIEVEAFSIGWGKKLVGYTYKGTEYRLSVFPVGGYCKMKGEDVLKEAWQENRDEIPKEEGSFFAAHPLKRIGVALSGPLFNVFFAVVVLSSLWLVGFTIQTFENRIVLASDYPLGENGGPHPADQAGLETGDRILQVAGQETPHFRALQEAVVPNAGQPLNMVVERDGRRISTTVTPRMNRGSGAGQIGIYAWVDPVIGQVAEGSAADAAGLQPGDRIVKAQGEPLPHSIAFLSVLADQPQTFAVTVERNGSRVQAQLSLTYSQQGAENLGIAFKPIMYRTPPMGPFRSIGRGTAETFETLMLTFRSIGLLFQGVDVRQAVSGPIQITYFVGEVASQGFSMGVGQGFSSVLSFLSLLSVALFVMNLLPIPALDGGQIVLFVFEMASGKPLNPKVVYRYQTVGVVLIFALILLAVLSDVNFLLNR